MKTYIRSIAAAAALVSGASCSVSIAPLGSSGHSMRRGPIPVNDWGIPVGNQQCVGVPYGNSQYGSNVQDNGSLRWDHHSSVVKIPISGNSRNRSYGSPTNYGQPVSGGGQFQPSGRTVECPGCHQRIGNAPSGTFPCQKCGATVSN